MNDRLPVLVLTGFLASGKTTLLNRLLRDGPRAAVLINEFGATPLDPLLIEREGLPIVTLAGGCLCCQVRGALAPLLKNLAMGRGRPGGPSFDRVIIETSGVASPEPVLDTLLRDRWLARRYRLDSVVTTVAAPSAMDSLARFPEAEAQVAWADVLAITQTDLADAATLARLEARLAALAPATPRLRVTRGDIDPATLTAPPGFRRMPEGAGQPDHGFQSVSLCLPDPMPWPRLAAALESLLARHPGLVRIKGLVHLPGAAEPVAVHAAAGRLYPPVSLPARPDTDGQGRLVLIAAGSVEGLAEDWMAELGDLSEPRPDRKTV